MSALLRTEKERYCLTQRPHLHGPTIRMIKFAIPSNSPTRQDRSLTLNRFRPACHRPLRYLRRRWSSAFTSFFGAKRGAQARWKAALRGVVSKQFLL